MKVAIYTARVTPAEFEAAIEGAWQMTRDSNEHLGLVPRVMSIVEGDVRPSIDVQRRLSEPQTAMIRCDLAFVASSLVGRSALKSWLPPESPDRRVRVFATYEAARAWLVARGVRASYLNDLYVQARRSLA